MRGVMTLRGVVCGMFVAAYAALSIFIPAIAVASAPYKDAGAKGFIGFCDKHKKAITSGSIYDQPFIWTAVSSVPPPSVYSGKNGKASLYAFQPRRNVDPAEWLGDQMEAASLYTNARHPMSQAVAPDPPLLTFVQKFPPQWDGLVQLRMIFSKPGVPLGYGSYPATTIHVQGARWSVVDGGTVSCNVGKAISSLQLLLPKSKLTAPPAIKPGGYRPTSSASPQAAGETRAGVNPGGISGGDVVRVGLVALPVFGGSGWGFYLLRKRKAA